MPSPSLLNAQRKAASSVFRLDLLSCADAEYTSKISDERDRRIYVALGLDVEEMNKLASADKIEKKYGNIMYELSGKTPRFTEFERLLPHLTKEQYELLLGQAEGWDRRNRGGSSQDNNA